MTESKKYTILEPEIMPAPGTAAYCVEGARTDDEWVVFGILTNREECLQFMEWLDTQPYVSKGVTIAQLLPWDIIKRILIKEQLGELYEKISHLLEEPKGCKEEASDV
jgi:hypothetical protein